MPNNLYAVQAGPDLGPLYQPTRKRARHSHGGDCSETDRIFEDTTSSQKTDDKVQDYLYENPLPTNEPLNPNEVIEDYQEMILDHVEKRIQFFFQQLIVCYRTKLHFESVGALDQPVSAEPILQDIEGTQTKFVARQAAHSSTNPCLIAYDKAKWKAYKEDMRYGEDVDKPNGFVFLKGTDYYRMMNATMNMPAWVNQADREIDELTNSSLLREKSIKIINQASKGKVTPDEGLIAFIKAGLEEVRTAQNRTMMDKPEVSQILEHYENLLVEIKKKVKNDASFLEKFVDLKIGDDEEAKKTILKLRYAAIRNCQLNQSKLMQKIEMVREKILDKNKVPPFFNPAFNTLFIEGAKSRSDENKQRLKRLLNFYPISFEKGLKASDKVSYRNTKDRILKPYLQKINSLAAKILRNNRNKPLPKVLNKEIDDKCFEILDSIKLKKKNPPYFEEAFKALVIQQADRDTKPRLMKLWSFSPSNFEAQLSARGKTIYLNTKNTLSTKFLKKIRVLAEDLSKDMLKLLKEDAKQRALTVKTLRTEVKHWTQQKLGNKIFALFPRAATSQSTISNIENGYKLVTDQIAQELSEVFEVDPGLFMPHFYYE